jgi:hypothetical protein
MEKRHIVYSSQHPPTPKRGAGNIILKGAPIRLKPVFNGIDAEHFLEAYLGQSTNLKLT